MIEHSMLIAIVATPKGAGVSPAARQRWVRFMLAVLACVLAVHAADAHAADPRPLGPGDVAEDPGRFAALPNLVVNGDFEQGEATPTGWQAVDGLSSFWVDDPDGQRGKVLKLDTDVLQSQAYEWWAQVREGAAAAAAPSKLPTIEPKYDTLAGLDGVWFWSDAIPVEKGKQYWLTVDVKGPGMKVLMRGYPQQPDLAFGADEGAFIGYLQKQAGTFKNERGRKAFIKKYNWDSWMKAGGGDGWQTYARREKPFSPTKNTPNVRYLRIMLYPYWPPGVYYIDNVRLTEYPPPADTSGE
jgi:hypothetical protein